MRKMGRLRAGNAIRKRKKERGVATTFAVAVFRCSNFYAFAHS